ncbi:MAG: hypothetical protein ACE37F_01690 [Nannocystaceae bacterium]|nr:hypothetical protein [bacterium]
MNGVIDSIFRWDYIVLAACLVVFGIAVAQVYRKSLFILGAPTLPAERGANATNYRRDPPKPLTPLHAAYLVNPSILPGMVILAPLVASGALGGDRRSGRLLPGDPAAGLDKHQRAALEQAPNCHMEFVARSLSTQMASELASDLRDSALQCPEGARGVPQAATLCLWSVATSLSLVGLTLAGPWGGLVSTLVLLVAYRAHRYRGFAPAMTLSEAGHAVLREQERRLDERLREKSGTQYSTEEVAWYVALKPLPYFRLPGVDENFAPILGDERPTGQDVELGGTLSEAQQRSACRVNRIRKGLLWTVGIAALLVALSSLQHLALSAIFWINVTLVFATLLRICIGLYLIRNWDGHLRESGAFLPDGAK